jgi:hypothetical protein
MVWYLYLAAFKITRPCHGRKKSLKTLKISSFLRLYFVIVEISSCISTMYYNRNIWY